MSTYRIRQFLILSTLVISFGSFAQDSLKFKFPQHILQIDPVSMIKNKWDFSFAQGILYRYSFSKSFYAEVNSLGVLVKKWDGRNVYFNNNKLFPAMSHTSVFAGYRLPIKSRINLKRLSHSKSFVGFRVGYHYSQYGSQGGEYWTRDISSDNAVTMITGLKMHSALAGVELEKTSYKQTKKGEKLKARHYTYLDYTYCLNYTIIGSTIYADGSYQKQKMDNEWGNTTSSFRLGYSFTTGISEYFGLTLGAEFLALYHLFYELNPLYAVLRGGENPYSGLLSLKLGLSFIK